jgi:hypothetical protein
MSTLESYLDNPEAFEAETRRLEAKAEAVRTILTAILAQRLRTATDRLETFVDRLDPSIGKGGAQ